MTIYYEVKISTENQEQADTILNAVLKKKLVTGGQFITSPARFLWKGKVQDMMYVMITSYTTERHKEAVISEVRELSAEEVPMIMFVALDDLNEELRKWIDETLI